MIVNLKKTSTLFVNYFLCLFINYSIQIPVLNHQWNIPNFTRISNEIEILLHISEMNTLNNLSCSENSFSWNDVVIYGEIHISTLQVDKSKWSNWLSVKSLHYYSVTFSLPITIHYHKTVTITSTLMPYYTIQQNAYSVLIFYHTKCWSYCIDLKNRSWEPKIGYQIISITCIHY